MAKSRRGQQPKSAARTAAARGGAATSSAPQPPPAAPQRSAVPPTRPAAAPSPAERVQQRRAARAAVQRQQRQQQLLRWLAFSVVAAMVVTIGIVLLARSGAFDAPPGQTAPIASRQHIEQGQKGSDYNTVPPTSGQHYGVTAETKVHDTPIPDEFQVHNLEHGQIMVQYTCTDCPELAAQLKVFSERYPKWVLVAPYPDPRVGARIVLTAWGRIDKFDQFDEGRIDRFIRAYRNKGPEQVITE